ncbi:uncharacterized protein [Antedon mediterranea]|uniref:uncharacterized protein n=1 Tax=Antedon mediterranea TaxID=105859 RepID=UPI003AF6F3C7
MTSGIKIIAICGLSFTIGVVLTAIHCDFTNNTVLQENRREPVVSTLYFGSHGDKQHDDDHKSTEIGPRKILLDCGGNMASTVELFRETYPDGKQFIIHSFEIDERLAPYFSPYEKHYLHCPVGVASEDGNMTAFTESAWAPEKGKNNGRDMQWGGGTLYVDKKELTDTDTGGRRKLSHRKQIPVVDVSKWIQENTRKEDYVIFKLDVEGAEFRILEKMLKDGTFAWIDKYYGEYHKNQPVGLSRSAMSHIIENVKTKGRKMFDWGAESRNYADFATIHPIQVPDSAPGEAGKTYNKCNGDNNLAITVNVGMTRKQAVRVLTTLKSYKIEIPVTVFVFSAFAEEWPELVKAWAKDYTIGLRGNHPYPAGHFEKMSPNWIREAVVSSEMRLQELNLKPMFYSPDEDGGSVKEQLKSIGFRIIKPSVNFPPKSEPLLTVQNYYRFRDVERIPKALRIISEKLQTSDGGILCLDTDLPDTYMNLVFLLDYLVENSDYHLVSLNQCLD